MTYGSPRPLELTPLQRGLRIDQAFLQLPALTRLKFKKAQGKGYWIYLTHRAHGELKQGQLCLVKRWKPHVIRVLLRRGDMYAPCPEFELVEPDGLLCVDKKAKTSYLVGIEDPATFETSPGRWGNYDMQPF